MRKKLLALLSNAGNCGKNRLFFEKDIMLKPRTWLYLRVEFPSELTWAVDPLLQYVKGYQPLSISIYRSRLLQNDVGTDNGRKQEINLS